MNNNTNVDDPVTQKIEHWLRLQWAGVDGDDNLAEVALDAPPHYELGDELTLQGAFPGKKFEIDAMDDYWTVAPHDNGENRPNHRVTQHIKHLHLVPKAD